MFDNLIYYNTSPLGSILDDTYDDRDVKWVKKNDAFLTNVLKSYRSQGDVKKGADLINEILLFRAKFALNGKPLKSLFSFFNATFIQ